MRMEKDWFERLKQVIESCGVSKRQLSTDAGFGPNWVQQMIKNEKEPGADKLTRLLSQFSRADALFVMTGLRITDADLEFLELASKVPEDARANLIGMLEALSKNEDAPLAEIEPSA